MKNKEILKPTIKSGVVLGSDYINLIGWCKNSGYALPAINVTSSSTMNAALEAAAVCNSDVIIQLSAGGARFFAGQGMSNEFDAQVVGAISAARHAHTVAEKYGICAVLHTDHANRKLLPWIDALIDAGEIEYQKTGRSLFSSHMLDLSDEPLEENLNECDRVLRRLSAIEMSLELELGITGGEEDGVGQDVDDIDNEKLYTQPEHVLEAFNRLSPLGHFTVAAAFGNVHGVYKPGNVHLRPEILKNTQVLGEKELGQGNKPFNFVFHGGSGSGADDIKNAINYGVVKINIDTDTQFAYSKPIGEYVDTHPNAFKFQIDPDTGEPYKKQYDPRKWIRLSEESMISRLQESFEIFGAAGNSVAI